MYSSLFQLLAVATTSKPSSTSHKTIGDITMWATLKALCAFLLFLIASHTNAQQFPGDRPLKIIVPATPGGTNDIIARAVAPHISQSMGVPIIVENKVGAGGRVGAHEVARAAPDGRTILMSASHIQATQKWVSKSLPYDPEKDFAPISMVGLSSNVLLVNSALPVKTVQELIAYAKANPQKLTYASVGVGTSSHLGAELFKTVARVEILHVPYNGSAPALKDLLGGQVNMQFENMPTALPHLKGGMVRAIGVTTKTRSPLLPEVPTVSESGLKDFEAAPWYCFVAPANTPSQIIARWHTEIEAALKRPDVVAMLRRSGIEPLPMKPAELGAFMAAESNKWRQIAERAGAKPE
jgi:tripartite-type tricarboxylate transporter receptor subunit TctC